LNLRPAVFRLSLAIRSVLMTAKPRDPLIEVTKKHKDIIIEKPSLEIWHPL
jgi:hypothetical protein